MERKKNSDQSSEASGAIQQLDQRLLELTALFEISQSLTSSLSIRSILENILRIPMGHMLISKGVVLLKKPEEDIFIIEEIRGLSRNLIGKTLDINQPPERSMFLHEIIEKDKWQDFFQEFGITLLLPLISSQGVIGVVGFGDKIGAKRYEEREVEFLNSLSNIAASAVSNGVMVEEIQKVNRDLDRKIQQLNTIFDISRELNTTLDREKIGSLLSFAVMGELLVNRCIVYVKEDHHLEVLVSKGVPSEISAPPELSEISEPFILEDTSRFESLKKIGIAMLVPMRLQDENKGLLAIGSKISGLEFNEADQEFLKTLGNQAMTSLENARLFEETLEKQRLEEELNLARSIQEGLLPSQLPELKGFQIIAQNISSRQVGGDYFDVIPITDHTFAIAIADVSGKGAGAALLMSNLQASLHALVHSELPIVNMMIRINDMIFQNTAMDKFITFFYCVLDIQNGRITYCNAGHNPPYQRDQEGKIHELMKGGIILGMMENMPYEVESCVLKPGERIVFYTDGITEAMNEKEEEFGEERLKNLIFLYPDLSAQEFMEKVNEEIDEFCGNAPQADDITMIVLQAEKSKQV